ncbi:MAG: hypothetical protein ACREMF_04560 [Gemmatimonadales bacterium]
MTRKLWILAAAALLLAGTDCGDSGSPAQPGTLRVSLTTPNTDDGAILFEVSGPAIDTMAPVNASYRLFTRRIGTTTVRAVLAGPVASGTVATLEVPDVGAAGSYTATVTEVVDRQNQLRPLSGYQLQVAP